ncbi:hypothetical protein NKH19_28495, partial [Mesorhizobium sp. M1338]|uniref:hypothetical protein n=1 Tax=unclassified Mesorhizobium TaxID=325217 RepID=UPI00333AC5CA
MKTLADTVAARETIKRQLRAPGVFQVDQARPPGADRSARPGSWFHALGSRRLFGCSDCNVAGRDRRPVFFTCIPDYEGQQRESNRDW